MPLFGRKKVTLVGMKKKDIPSGLWEKCPQCATTTYKKELVNNLNVCPKCDHHLSLTARSRVDTMIDEGTFKELDSDLKSQDPLKFKGPKTYIEKITADQKRTGIKEAVITGYGLLLGRKVALAATDSSFIMGSMGSVVGERLTRLVEYAMQHDLPVVIISGSGGGARMYEGALSLMQMAKVCAALSRHHKKGLLHISVLTNPTMGGVMASFAGIGDVIISEPQALVGFAGPRVVEQTIRQKLPEGFQKAEFMLAHGLIDMVVQRRDLVEKISEIINYSQKH